MAAAARTLLSPASISEIARRACGSSASPSRVRPTERVVRWKSEAPSCPSSSRTWSDSADCDRRESSAARRKLPCSATSRKALRSLRLTDMAEGPGEGRSVTAGTQPVEGEPRRAQRRQRSELSVPASSERFFAKAAGGAADAVVLDLEDGVTPDRKDAARTAAIGAINGLDWGGRILSVRVNGIGTPWCHRDIVEVATACPRLDRIVLPKSEEAFDIRFLAALLDGIERARGEVGRPPIGIAALVETPKGVGRVEEIAAAHPRLETVIFGLGDYMAEMRTPDSTVGLPNPDYAMPGEPAPHLLDQWHYALARIANACRAAGVSADRRRLRRLPGRGRPSRLGAPLARAGLRREVGDPPGPGRGHQRGVRARSGAGGMGAAGAGAAGALGCRRRRRRGRGRNHGRRGARADGARHPAPGGRRHDGSRRCRWPA